MRLLDRVPSAPSAIAESESSSCRRQNRGAGLTPSSGARGDIARARAASCSHREDAAMVAPCTASPSPFQCNRRLGLRRACAARRRERSHASPVRAPRGRSYPAVPPPRTQHWSERTGGPSPRAKIRDSLQAPRRDAATQRNPRLRAQSLATATTEQRERRPRGRAALLHRVTSARERGFTSATTHARRGDEERRRQRQTERDERNRQRQDQGRVLENPRR